MSYIDEENDDNEVYDEDFVASPPIKAVIELGVRRPFTDEEIKRLKNRLDCFVGESSDKLGVEIKNDGPLKYFISYESIWHPYKDILLSINDRWPLSVSKNIRWLCGYIDVACKHIIYPNQNIIDLSKDKKTVRDLFYSYNPILLAYALGQHVNLFRSVGFLESIASLFLFKHKLTGKIDPYRPYYLEQYEDLSINEWARCLFVEKDNRGFQMFEIDEFQNTLTVAADKIERVFDENTDEEGSVATSFSVEDISTGKPYKIYVMIKVNKILDISDEPKLKMYAFLAPQYNGIGKV